MKAKIVTKIRILFRSILFLLLFWFIIFANYGAVDFFKFKNEIRRRESELVVLNQEKDELLKYVRALSGPEIRSEETNKNSCQNGPIDIDLLEMQARKILAYARKDEMVYFWK